MKELRAISSILHTNFANIKNSQKHIRYLLRESPLYSLSHIPSQALNLPEVQNPRTARRILHSSHPFISDPPFSYLFAFIHRRLSLLSPSFSLFPSLSISAFLSSPPISLSLHVLPFIRHFARLLSLAHGGSTCWGIRKITEGWPRIALCAFGCVPLSCSYCCCYDCY